MNTRLALALASLLAPGVASSAQAQQVATRGATPTRPAAISAADLDVLKAQLEALQSRIA